MALFLQPVFKDRIWGGHALKAFNYDILMKQLVNAGQFLHIQMVLIQLSMVHTRI